MSDSRATIRDHVRTLLKDRDPSNYESPSYLLEYYINQVQRWVGGQVRRAQVWVTPAITLAPPNGGVAPDTRSDYQLPTTQEYRSVIVLRLVSLGWDLRRVDHEQMEALRRSPSGSIAKGPPDSYELTENDAQQITVRLFPIPAVADTIDALFMYTPTNLAADSDTLPFDRDLITAVELFTAQRAAAALSPDALARRGLNPAAVQAWGNDAKDLLEAAAIRINRQVRTGVVSLRNR